MHSCALFKNISLESAPEIACNHFWSYMRATIDRILEGKFNYEKGSLDFSCTRLEINVSAGELYTGSFGISSAPGRLSEGYIFTNDVRMQLLSDYFSGTAEEIGFTFSAKGLAEGDVVKGDIYVVSNQGEYYLPYVVNVSHSTLDSSLGSIRNLFHFANLAKMNWDEAVALFYNDEFKNIFKGNDKQYLKAYLGLSAYYGNEQNVEEFLLEINKKQPTEYIVERKSIVVDEPDNQVQEYIDITRNGWGYTSLSVICDADFIVLSKENISESDFLGNYLHYEFVIDPYRFHSGNNYATIRFFNAFTSFEVTVKVNGNTIDKPVIAKDIEYSRAMMDIITFYKAFRLRRISADSWMAETGLIVDRLQSLRPDDRAAKMFKAQLLITEERYNEAKWILDQIEATFEEGEYLSPQWAYYLYLTTLVNREEPYIDRITEEVENIYNSDSAQWRVAWLLLYLSAEYAVSPVKKWLFIENQLSFNCTSPVMFVEAANMLLLNSALLTKLEDIELRVINFMIKEGILTREIARQIVYLAGSGKWYSKRLVEILKKCYELNLDTESLATICELMINNNLYGPEYYQWYKLGIEEEVRVTNIYEYYMLSLDLSRNIELPKMVYLYFSYENSLDWEHAAYLYARIIDNRDSLDGVFDNYSEQIERFAINQVAEGHMNKDLAVIYRFVLNEHVLSKDMANRLAPLIFTHRISIDSDLPAKVIVYQSRECVSESYPIVNKEAFVPLYYKDYFVMFEDNFSNRYIPSVNYDIEKLIIPGKLASMLTPSVEDNLSFDVYACESSGDMVDVNEENRERYQHILDSFEIESSYKTEIRSKLMQYYYDNDKIRELDAILDALDPEEMSGKERRNCIKFMIMRGMYDKAFDWVCDYGMEGMEPKNMVKLCSSLISRGDFEVTPRITSICAACFFKGKYDEAILKYLCTNFFGLSKDMKKLFTAAQNFDIDVFGMCENMLVQMLYTGYYISERINIYRKYIQGGASTKIQMAFLAQCCYDYFVKEQLTESFVFDELTRLKSQGEEFLTVQELAYVKFYSENPDLVGDTQREFIKGFLDDLIGKGIYFSYFKEFMEQGVEEINRFTDKTFIEYKTDPGKKVTIHYIVETESEAKGEYITREMPDMYGGVHSMAFVLFFGENLQYYITEDINGEELLTESGNITKNDIGSDISTSRFSEINDIVISHTLGDYETLEHLVYEYKRKEYLIKKLFTMK